MPLDTNSNSASKIIRRTLFQQLSTLDELCDKRNDAQCLNKILGSTGKSLLHKNEITRCSPENRIANEFLSVNMAHLSINISPPDRQTDNKNQLNVH